MIQDPMPIGAGYVTTPSVPAISRETNKSVYRKVVGGVTYTTTISHSTNKGRRRTSVRLDASQVVSNPYVTAQNVEDTTSSYLVIDRSERLATDAEVIAHVVELMGTLGIATKTNIVDTRLTQIVQGES